MRILLAVIDKGSFSAAARGLGLPVQTISRRIADLEHHLGARLLTRTTRALALTDAGATYAAAARRIVEDVEEAEREVAGEYAAPRGDLVIAAPLFFGRLHVVPLVADFLARHPEINIRLVLGDRNVNLFDDQVDMAVRIGELADSSMIATRVGAVRAVVAASSALLVERGTPVDPKEIGGHPCIAPDGPGVTSGWRFRDPGKGVIFEVPVTPRLVTTAEAGVEAAVHGLGLVRSLSYQVDDAVRAGKLVVVLERFELDPLPVHLLHAPRGQLPLKMRRFLDHAAPRLRAVLARIGVDPEGEDPRTRSPPKAGRPG